MGTSLVLAAIQSIVLVSIGALVAQPLVFNHYATDVRWSALIFWAFVPLYLSAVYLMCLLNGMQRLGAFQALRLLQILPAACGIVALSALHILGIRGAVIVYLSAQVVALAVASFLALKGGGNSTSDH